MIIPVMMFMFNLKKPVKTKFFFAMISFLLNLFVECNAKVCSVMLCCVMYDNAMVCHVVLWFVCLFLLIGLFC